MINYKAMYKIMSNAIMKLEKDSRIKIEELKEENKNIKIQRDDLLDSNAKLRSAIAEYNEKLRIQTKEMSELYKKINNL